MTVQVATLGLNLDSNGMRAGLNDLKQVERVGNRAADALDDAGRRGTKAMGNLRAGFGSLQSALAALGLGAAIKQVVSINDEYARITGRLKLVTNGTAELAQVQEQLFQVAQRTGAAYADTAGLYTRVAQNAKDLGLTQQQLIAFTETTAQAFQVSGASAEEAAGAIRQLTQGLAAGALRGDEFNSVNESGPRIMQALADSLGVTRGALRDMAADGKITAEIVVGAMQRQAKVIAGEFNQLPVTVGRAMTELENEVKRAIAGADVSPLTESIRELKDVLSDPGTVQALATLAGGLADVAKWVVELIALFPKVATNVGEFFGSIAEGSRQSIPAVERQIKLLREMRDRPAAGNAALSLIPGAVDVRFLAASNDELDAEIRRNQDLLDSLVGNTSRSAERFDEAQKRFATAMVAYNQALIAGASPEVLSSLGKAVDVARGDMERFAPALDAVGGAAAGAADDLGLLPMTLGGTSKEAEKAKKKIDDMIRSLEEEFFITNDLTKSEEVRISLANGYYGVVSAGQAAEMQGIADLITRRDEDKKKTEEQIEAQDKLRKLTAISRAEQNALESQGRALGREVSDIGLGPAARRYSGGRAQIDERFADRQFDLAGQLSEGQINKDQYDSTLESLSGFHDQALAQWDTYYQKLEAKSADFTSGFNDTVLSYLDSTRNLGSMLGNDVVGSIDQATQATSRLAAETLLWGEGGVEAAKAIARSVITDVVSSLIRVGIQYGINAALQNTAIGTTTAAAVTSAGTIATAQVGANSAIAASAAPAAAATSLASFGTNIGPALAAIAGAYAAARIFNIGFEEGGYTGNGGRSEVAGVVHRGEYVMDADVTRRHRGLLDHLSAGGAAPIRQVAPPSTSGAPPAPAPRGGVKILNLWDIADIRAAILDSDEADEIQLNRISRKGSRYRTAIGAEG